MLLALPRSLFNQVPRGTLMCGAICAPRMCYLRTEEQIGRLCPCAISRLHPGQGWCPSQQGLLGGCA